MPRGRLSVCATAHVDLVRWQTDSSYRRTHTTCWIGTNWPSRSPLRLPYAFRSPFANWRRNVFNGFNLFNEFDLFNEPSVNEFFTQEPALKLLSLIRPRAPSVLSLAAVVLLLSGCASTPPPLQEMAVAEAALQRASSTGTSSAAPGELATAAAKLASARSAMAAGQSDRARQLALEATVDA